MKPHIFEQILGKENPDAVPAAGIVDFWYPFLDAPEKPSTQVSSANLHHFVLPVF
ncbi:uncharacterized protein PGTG_21998 [Puccinia graminis f. sp. tritici CRL 75-36-700-3]|uniref:Uncharacterized protein n=1 Tax=Puccinia graminis f. sp. tritici (strain CRL 75-36-700-3 / race SCCL) TaxID=418459 RepID=H6QT80_PUCGT|nr:uncharacterized protein PGTG_21998 [Puccinia graminis f. sp. tritici CRL 75-36-700-3]EHS64034.1 hypothetical protein PGTG_21998 [Puccinia graminis f. sp. tritici CRL 75-36-700-3]